MKRFDFQIRTAAVIGLVALVCVVQASPIAARFDLKPRYEPTPRPTATAAPSIELEPDQGVAGNANQTQVTGYFFVVGAPLYFLFDVTPIGTLDGVQWYTDGSFTALVPIPVVAEPGGHQILVRQPSSGMQAAARYELIAPTPTNTPEPSATTAPSDTPTPVTPSATPEPTDTALPTATLRPITPVTTATPVPPPTRKPVTTPADTPAPRSTSTPCPTSTPVTDTPTSTPTDTPTAMPTPGEGTSVAALPPTAPPGPAPTAGLPTTGSDWEASFLRGFITAILVIVLLTTFMIVVLVTLLVAYRFWRMRQLQQQG